MPGVRDQTAVRYIVAHTKQGFRIWLPGVRDQTAVNEVIRFGLLRGGGVRDRVKVRCWDRVQVSLN